MSEFEKLLDFSQPLDVNLLDQVWLLPCVPTRMIGGSCAQAAPLPPLVKIQNPTYALERCGAAELQQRRALTSAVLGCAGRHGNVHMPGRQPAKAD